MKHIIISILFCCLSFNMQAQLRKAIKFIKNAYLGPNIMIGYERAEANYFNIGISQSARILKYSDADFILKIKGSVSFGNTSFLHLNVAGFVWPTDFATTVGLRHSLSMSRERLVGIQPYVSLGVGLIDFELGYNFYVRRSEDSRNSLRFGVYFQIPYLTEAFVINDY